MERVVFLRRTTDLHSPAMTLKSPPLRRTHLSIRFCSCGADVGRHRGAEKCTRFCSFEFWRVRSRRRRFRIPPVCDVIKRLWRRASPGSDPLYRSLGCFITTCQRGPDGRRGGEALAPSQPSWLSAHVFKLGSNQSTRFGTSGSSSVTQKRIIRDL